MGLYSSLGADEQALVDGQVERMLADPTRIPSKLRQQFAGDSSGLKNALRESYSDSVMIDLLRQQRKAGELGCTPL